MGRLRKQTVLAVRTVGQWTDNLVLVKWGYAMRNGLFLFLAFVLTPALPAQQRPLSSIGGNWTATFADSLSSGHLAITLQLQSGRAVTGTYKASSGGTGTIAGKLEGSTLDFTLTQTVEGCPGSFTGTVTFSGNSGTGAFSGKDCLGAHERGVISFARATVRTAATAQPAQQTPAERERAKLVAGLAPGTFSWSKVDCSYCRNLYVSGVPFEVIVTPDETVAATMGRRGSLWHGAIIVINESNHQIDVLRKFMRLSLIWRTKNGTKSAFAKEVSPRSLARQRGRRIALGFFSGLAMSGPSYSQTNIYGTETPSGFSGTAYSYNYGGANKVLAYSNYLRGLAAMRERANWIEQVSFKDQSLFHGQSTQGLLWFRGKGNATIAGLIASVDGKTFLFGWVNSGRH